jgi:hypothetical protein
MPDLRRSLGALGTPQRLIWQEPLEPKAHPAASSPIAMERTPKSNNTWPILTLVGAEILCLMAYVAACEVRSKEPALCESRWAMALPAIALAGQSAATYFMDPNRQPPPPSGDSPVSGRAMGPVGRSGGRWGRGRPDPEDTGRR